MAGQRSMPDLISTLRIMIDQASITRVNGALNTIRGTTVSPKVDVAPMQALNGVMLTAEQHMTSLVGSSRLGSDALQLMGNSGTGLGNALKGVENAFTSLSPKVVAAKQVYEAASAGATAAADTQAKAAAMLVGAQAAQAEAAGIVAAAEEAQVKATADLVAAQEAMVGTTEESVAANAALSVAEAAATEAATALVAAQQALAATTGEVVVVENLKAAADMVAQTSQEGLIASTIALAAAQAAAMGPMLLIIGAIAAIAFAVGGAVKVMSDGEKASAAFAASVYKLQQRIGGSTETASALVDTFTALGLSSDSASTAFYRLQTTAARNSAVFKQYGMTIATDTQGHIDWIKTLGNAADAYTKAETTGKGAAAAQAIFGLAGRNLIPLLAEGRQAVMDLVKAEEDSGPKMDKATVEMFNQYKIGADAMKQVNDAAAISIGNVAAAADHGAGLIGILTGQNNLELAALGDQITKTNLLDIVTGKFTGSINDEITAKVKLAKVNADLLTQQEAAAAADKKATAIMALPSDRTGVEQANDAVAKSTDKITAAVNALHDAQAAMAHDGVSDIQKLAKAYDAQVAAQLKAIATAQTLADKQVAAQLKAIAAAQTLADKQDAAAIKAIDEQIKQKDQAFQLLQTKQQIANINDKLATDEADIALASYQGNYAEAAKLNKTLTTDKQTQATDAARTQLDADKNAADAQKQQIQDAQTARHAAATAEIQQIQDAQTARKDAAAAEIQGINDAKAAQDKAYADKEAAATRQKDLALAVKNAEEAVTQAKEDQTKAYEALGKAQVKVWEDQQKALGDNVTQVQLLEENVINLAAMLAQMDPANSSYAALKNTLYQLQNKGAMPPSASSPLVTLPSAGGSNSFVSGGHGQLMASGGDLAAGQAAVVGDQGWELFVPKVAGTIIPHDQSVAAMNAGTSGGSSGSAGTQPGGGDVHYHIAVTAPNYYGPEAQLGELIIAKVSELHHRL